MPFALNKDWNLVMRVIVPLVSQPPLFDGGEAAFGVSDILASFFLSPSQGGVDLGRGTGHQPFLHDHSNAGNGEVERRPDGGRAEADGEDDVRGALESGLVLLREHSP
jgi:hypothetical protein